MPAGPKDQTTQADRDALNARLTRLAKSRAEVQDGWRRRNVEEPGALLTLFAREIDETVFARRLSVRIDTGSVLHLEAANRRLRRIVEPFPSELAQFATQLAEPLHGHDPEALALLRNILEVFAGDSAAIFIQGERLDKADAANLHGISGEAMANAWALELLPDPPKPVDRLIALRKAIASHCSAWMLRGAADGEFEASAKDAPLVLEAPQIAVWAEILAQSVADFPGAGAGVFTAQPTDAGGTALRLCAIAGDAVFAADTHDLSIDEAQSLWNATEQPE